jgi:hypothetical protein
MDRQVPALWLLVIIGLFVALVLVLNNVDRIREFVDGLTR